MLILCRHGGGGAAKQSEVLSLKGKDPAKNCLGASLATPVHVLLKWTSVWTSLPAFHFEAACAKKITGGLHGPKYGERLVLVLFCLMQKCKVLSFGGRNSKMHYPLYFALLNQELFSVSGCKYNKKRFGFCKLLYKQKKM